MQASLDRRGFALPLVFMFLIVLMGVAFITAGRREDTRAIIERAEMRSALTNLMKCAAEEGWVALRESPDLPRPTQGQLLDFTKNKGSLPQFPPLSIKPEKWKLCITPEVKLMGKVDITDVSIQLREGLPPMDAEGNQQYNDTRLKKMLTADLVVTGRVERGTKKLTLKLRQFGIWPALDVDKDDTALIGVATMVSKLPGVDSRIGEALADLPKPFDFVFHRVLQIVEGV